MMNDYKRRAQLLPLALSCGILLAACSRDPNVRKQKYLSSAAAFLKKGNTEEATLQLRNALKVDPNFAEAANILAELQFRQGNYGEAYKLLIGVESAQPDYLPARKGLAQLYRLGGKLAEAEREAAYILEHTPDDIDELLNLSAIQAAQKKVPDAEGTLAHILELQPSHVPALLALAKLKADAQDFAGAERILKVALERNPRSITVYLALIQFYANTSRPGEAEPLFSQALKVSNNRVEVLEAQAAYYESLSKFPEAEEAIRKIQSSHADDPRYWAALADFYVRRGDWAKARTELERVSSHHPNDAVLLHKLIEVHLNQDDRNGAEALNEALLQKNPDDSYGHLFKGRMYLGKDVDKALLEFAEAQKYQANLPGLYYWYAQAYLQRGELGQAKQALDTTLKYDPGFQTARLALAELQNRTGSLDAAMDNAKRLMQSSPGDVRPMLVYSQSLMLKQDYAQAETIVKAVSERDPQSAEAHRQLGLLDLAHKNWPAARKELLQAWNLTPQSTSLLEGVLVTYVAENETIGAIHFLQDEIRSHPRDAELYHELAQLYLVQNKRPDAIAALKTALSLSPASGDTALLLSEVYARGQETEQAAQIVSQLVQKDQGNPDLLLRAGMVFERAQQWDEARKAYERVVQLDRDNAIAKNNLAWLLAEHGGNIDVALNLAQDAKQQSVNNLQITDTIGWIYYKKGIYKTALDYLKECAAKDSKNATFQYQLGMVYWKLGEKEDARRLLLNALTLNPNLPESKSAQQVLIQLL